MQKPRLQRCGPAAVSAGGVPVGAMLLTEVSLSEKPPLKALMTTSSCCFSMICGVVEKMRKAVSRRAESCDWLSWNKAPSSSDQGTPICFRRCSATSTQSAPTFICVLAGELGDGISDLAAHRRVRLVVEALEQFGAYGLALGRVEGQEEVRRLACGRLARLGRLAPEDDGCKCPRLWRLGKQAHHTTPGGFVFVLPRCPVPAQSAPTGP